MRVDIIIFLLAYLVITIFGVGWLIQWREKKKGVDANFAMGDGTLGVWAIGTTLVLIMLGSGHTIGTFENVYSVGVSTIWFIMAHGFLLVIVALSTGMWARRMKVTSIGDALHLMYGEKIRYLISAINIVVCWVIMACETQAMGICINTITGMDLRVAVWISGIAGLMYIILGGMNQNAKLNQLNIVVMYGGLILALWFVAKSLPGGNFDTVQNFFNSDPERSITLSIFGEEGYMLETAIPSMLTPILAFATGQSMLQTCAAAKSEKTLRRTALFMGPLNAICGCLSIAMALTAMANPAYSSLSAKNFTLSMLIDILPTWLISLFLAATVIGLLSTIAGNLLSSSTILTNDYVKSLFMPKMSNKAMTRFMRIFSVVGIIISTVLAQFLPPILVLFVWMYSFMVPSCFLYITGLWWKRSVKVALISCVIPWVCACVWTFTPVPSWIGMENVHQFYVISIISLVVLIVGNLMVKGEPGYFKTKEWLESQEYKEFLKERKMEMEEKGISLE